MQFHGGELDKTQERLGPIWLTPEVTKTHCLSLFFGSFFTIGILTIISAATTYILWENLNIPSNEWGAITGDLAFWTELTQILMFGVIGVAADKIGRRPIYVAGLLAFGLGYALYPFAQSLGQLTLYRVIYAAGLAMSTGMLITISADYPQNASRGKMVALIGVLNGLGVVVLNIFYGYLPTVFTEAGYDAVTAGRYSLFVIVSICLTVALVLKIGLKPGVPIKTEQPVGLLTLSRAGFRQAKNPRIAYAYASAFVARSDAVILGTFLMAWGVSAGQAMGLTVAQATQKGTMIFVITQSSALLFSPVVGFFMDKMNRITGVTVCMFLGGIGFTAPVLINNPLDSSAIPIFIIMGLGQISVFLGATILIGQEAPVKERGSVLGMFNIFGAIGILVAASIGGRLFDQVAPWAPFVLIGATNFIMVFVGIYVRQIAPGYIPISEQNFIKKMSGRTL
jgi:MFS family permease